MIGLTGIAYGLKSRDFLVIAKGCQGSDQKNRSFSAIGSLRRKSFNLKPQKRRDDLLEVHLTEGKTFFFKPAQEAALYRSVVRKYVLSLPRIEADDKSVPGTALHPWVCPELGRRVLSQQFLGWSAVVNATITK